MNLKEVIRSDKVNFTGIESSYFLLGLKLEKKGFVSISVDEQGSFEENVCGSVI